MKAFYRFSIFALLLTACGGDPPAGYTDPSVRGCLPTTTVDNKAASPGTVVTVNGSDLENVGRVTFGRYDAIITSKTSSVLICKVPEGDFAAGQSTKTTLMVYNDRQPERKVYEAEFWVWVASKGGNYDPPATDDKIYVASVAELNALSGTLAAGDTVVLRNGTYASQQISLKANGTAQAPVVITGETPGGVILTGSSAISFSGQYITVRDLWFKDPVLAAGSLAVINFRTNSSTLAYNCRVTGCAITGAGTQPAPDTDYKWVSIYGTDNRVDNCSFIDKKNMGTLLVVWIPADTNAIPAHEIVDNYFSRPYIILDENGEEKNGQEVIRVGDSGTSMRRADCLVEGNRFYECNGEMEAISSKTCFNTYRGNLLESSAATLTLRHGNDCMVENNFFIGDDHVNSGGVRVIGERHVVKGNYFENLTGINYRAAICLIRGVPNPALSSYYQVQNVLVENNTIVNCTQGISANYGSSSMTDPVISTVVRHNTIVNENSTNYSARLYITDPAAEITWTDNTIYKGRQYNLSLPTVSAKPVVASQTAAVQAIRTRSGVDWTLNL